MKRKSMYYVGLILIVLGIALFIFYLNTGIVFFKDYDLITEVENPNPKIQTYEDYIARGRYEDTLLIISILSFIIGIIIAFDNKMKSFLRSRKKLILIISIITGLFFYSYGFINYSILNTLMVFVGGLLIFIPILIFGLNMKAQRKKLSILLSAFSCFFIVIDIIILITYITSLIN